MLPETSRISQQSVHGFGLGVPARFPAGKRIATEPQQPRQLGLGQTEVLPNAPDLIGRQEAVLLSIDRDSIFAQPPCVLVPKVLRLERAVLSRSRPTNPLAAATAGQGTSLQASACGRRAPAADH